MNPQEQKKVEAVIACAEEMLAALKAAKVFLIDDELYAQTKELRATIDRAIAHADRLKGAAEL